MREVLEDADLSVPITLLHDGGSESATRGIVGRAPLIVDELDAPAKLSAWVPSPANEDRVREVQVTRRDGVRDVYTVLQIEPTTGAQYGNAMSETTEYGLRLIGVADTARDFDPADFSSADYG